jgi:hypothetical protein
MSRRLLLNSADNCRRSLGRILRDFNAAGTRQEPDQVQTFRAVVNAFSVLLAFHRVEQDSELIRRFEAIEGLVFGDSARLAQIRLRAEQAAAIGRGDGAI